MPPETGTPFLDTLLPQWGAAERFPVLFHMLSVTPARALNTGLCESHAYRSRMFSCASPPKPVSRCFPR